MKRVCRGQQKRRKACAAEELILTRVEQHASKRVVRVAMGGTCLRLP
jgi:hypothetical protein